METRQELQSLKLRVEKIEVDVRDTRFRLAELESALAAAEREAAGVAVPLRHDPDEWHVPKVRTSPPAPPEVPVPQPVLRSEPPPLPVFFHANAPEESPAAKTGHDTPPPSPRIERFVEETLEPHGPSALRVWLEKLQLWPPAGEGNAEVRLGAWWATRVGALLAVMGVVFFGIYISLNTPPWVKLAELALVSVAVTGAGLWLDRRWPAFGSVVFGSGLALLYFTSYAAHAVPAVKVIESAWHGAACQMVTVAIMVAASLWRGASNIAVMAVTLGYVTAFFSRGDGLNAFALWTAGLLAMVSVGLKRRNQWEGPSVVALPAAYALLTLIWGDLSRHGNLPPVGWAWASSAGLLILFFARDWQWRPLPDVVSSRAEKGFQMANSSLAAALGFLLTYLCYPDRLMAFYFGAAGLLAVLAAARERQFPKEEVGSVLMAKASGALTLGVISWADARSTAIALLVQAWVMAWTARKTESRILATCTGLVAMVAAGFHFATSIQPTPVVSIPALQSVLFALGLAALATQAARWLVKDEAGRNLLEWLTAGVSGLAAFVAIHSWTPPGYAPAMLVGMTVLFGLLALPSRGSAPAGAGALTLLIANVLIWQACLPTGPGGNIAINALLVLGATSVVAWKLGGTETGRIPGAAVAGLVVFGLGLVLFDQLAPLTALVWMSLIGLGLGTSSHWVRGRFLDWLGTGCAGLGVCLWSEVNLPQHPVGLLVLSGAVLWCAPVWDRIKAGNPFSGAALAREYLQSALALLVTCRAFSLLFAGADLVMASVLGAIAISFLGMKPRLRSAWAASGVMMMVAVFSAGELDAGVVPPLGKMELLASILFAWVPAWVLARGKSLADEGIAARVIPAVMVFLPVVISITVAGFGFSGLERLMVSAMAVLTATAMFRMGKIIEARAGASVLAGQLFLLGFSEVLTLGRGVGGAGLVLMGAVSILLGYLPRLLAGEPLPWARDQLRVARWIGGSLGLGLWFLACRSQKAELAVFVTVGWGLGAAISFLGGLLLRSAPHRLIGLTGILLCIPRVFLVDLSSALHRILAFMVLGGVLLWIGFSYHRFRHLMIEDET